MALYASHLLSGLFFFFFNDTATTEIYTLSLHDALPISFWRRAYLCCSPATRSATARMRSEEHTSELQSRGHVVCRLLLEKKKKKNINYLRIIIKRPVAGCSNRVKYN